MAWYDSLITGAVDITDSLLDNERAKDTLELEAQELLLSQQNATSASASAASGNTDTLALIAALGSLNKQPSDNSNMYTLLIIGAIGLGLYFFLKKQ